MTTKVSFVVYLSEVEISLKDISLERINKMHELILQDDGDWYDVFDEHVREVVAKRIKKAYPRAIIGNGQEDDLSDISEISTKFDRQDLLDFIDKHIPCCDRTKMKIPEAKFCSQCGTAL